ncbi:hypothetical protein LNV09_19835 [Paucibacter sp. B2R-40]|uniref:hypothetical protein n=1 Tax=Paucibacter sp. B2R-40 TaxID=2893554 RepID=UPI0021E47905|nr:hypothetical protein [Paucibacter sp. B2R-40]MCV2356397.1 hypothetical protein [Paucibacter sp. B2R-40]
MFNDESQSLGFDLYGVSVNGASAVPRQRGPAMQDEQSWQSEGRFLFMQFSRTTQLSSAGKG